MFNVGAYTITNCMQRCSPTFIHTHTHSLSLSLSISLSLVLSLSLSLSHTHTNGQGPITYIYYYKNTSSNYPVPYIYVYILARSSWTVLRNPSAPFYYFTQPNIIMTSISLIYIIYYPHTWIQHILTQVGQLGQSFKFITLFVLANSGKQLKYLFYQILVSEFDRRKKITLIVCFPASYQSRLYKLLLNIPTESQLA